MPFRSKRQRAFMFANHPTIAKKWAKKYGSAVQPKKKGSSGRSRKRR